MSNELKIRMKGAVSDGRLSLTPAGEATPATRSKQAGAPVRLTMVTAKEAQPAENSLLRARLKAANAQPGSSTEKMLRTLYGPQQPAPDGPAPGSTLALLDETVHGPKRAEKSAGTAAMDSLNATFDAFEASVRRFIANGSR